MDHEEVPGPDEAILEMPAGEEDQPATADALPQSKFEEVNTVRAVLRKIDTLPNEMDGLKLDQFKRMAKNSGEGFLTHLTAVLKLAD